jgi:N-acyl-D-aspartate/D-glutamate deacylase
VLRRLEAARDQGADVRFDVYPYDASSSAAMQYLPDWVGAGGAADLQRNAADPQWRRSALPAIAEGWYGHIPWFWDRIVLSGAPGHEDVVGLGFDEIAQRWSIPPEQVLLDLCVELGTKAQVVLHYRVDDDVQAFLAHPMSMIGSDGLARSLAPEADHPHPRSFGTFPRVLGRYVRELGTLSLADAVHKMTGAPARQLGLHDRGVVAVGNVADLVVFDPAVICDRATFEAPRTAPIGVERVIVAGQVVALNGRVLPARPGRLLRLA